MQSAFTGEPHFPGINLELSSKLSGLSIQKLSYVPSVYQPIFVRSKFPLTEDLLRQRILSKMVIVDDCNPDECILWSGVHDKDGYPRLRIMCWNGSKKTEFVVSRLVTWLFKGEDPTGLQTCHSCDNPYCINPLHLWLGTAEENSQDAISKGRHTNQQSKVEGASFGACSSNGEQ